MVRLDRARALSFFEAVAGSREFVVTPFGSCGCGDLVVLLLHVAFEINWPRATLGLKRIGK